MPIRRARSLRALAVQERARAADAAERAEAALASIDAEIAMAQRDLAELSAPDRAPRVPSGRAALLEADALDRASRRARSRALEGRLAALESDRAAARRDRDAAQEALAQAIRKLKSLAPQ